MLPYVIGFAKRLKLAIVKIIGLSKSHIDILYIYVLLTSADRNFEKYVVRNISRERHSTTI